MKHIKKYWAFYLNPLLWIIVGVIINVCNTSKSVDISLAIILVGIYMPTMVVNLSQLDEED